MKEKGDGWRIRVPSGDRIWLSTVIASEIGPEAYWDLVKQIIGNPNMVLYSAEDLLDQQFAHDHLEHVSQMVKDGILRIECWGNLSQRLPQGYWFSSLQMMTKPCNSLEEVWDQLPKEKRGVIQRLCELVMEYGQPRESWHTADCVDPPREMLTEDEAAMLGLPRNANQSQIIEAAKQKRVDVRHIVLRLMKAVATQHGCGGNVLGEAQYLK